MVQTKVLFLCLHNSARSQIAEAYLKKYGGEIFEVESAGFSPSQINPLVVDVMKEEGIDISTNKLKTVFALFKEGYIFHYVIRVCDLAAKEQCPIFPSMAQMIDWSFKDPSTFTGTYEEKLAQTRMVRDEIKEQIQSFIRTIRKSSSINS